jgi:hypothetical protein
VRVCLIKNKKFDVYCGRGKGVFNDPYKCVPGQDAGWLGNPVRKNISCIVCKKIHEKLEDILLCYSLYLEIRLNNDLIFKNEFIKLKGKKLACWCPLNKPCHVDLILKRLDKFSIFLF